MRALNSEREIHHSGSPFQQLKKFCGWVQLLNSSYKITKNSEKYFLNKFPTYTQFTTFANVGIHTINYKPNFNIKTDYN